MKKQRQNSKTVAGVVLGVLGVLVVGAVCGMTFAVNRVKELAIAKTPTAILASAGVTDGADIDLAVTYFDERQDECANLYDDEKMAEGRQFEWSSCGYGGWGVEQGMVDFALSRDYLPVLTAGSLTPNRGLGDTTRWFAAVEGKSKEYLGSLKLSYRVNEGQAEFSYESAAFYPLDEAEFSEGDAANRDGHNHLWTMNFAVPFTAVGDGNESFMITTDDDTFVFVGDKLALDMGGVHGAVTGRLEISENGEVYTGVGDEALAYSGIVVGESSVIRIFHADRDAESSELAVKFTGMNLNVVKSEIAGTDDGIQIAYDPSNPSYVAPLGESKVFQPDGTKGFIIMATVFGMTVVVFSVLLGMTVKRLVRK